MSKIVSIAAAQVGIREATGANDGTPSSRYMGGRREPWCAHFAVWCYRTAGVKVPKDRPGRAGVGGENPLASVDFFETTMKREGWWLPHATAPQPGDLVFFADRTGSDRGGGRIQRHMGVVETFDEFTDVVHTIEGNIANQVARRVHRHDDPRITGYARPPVQPGEGASNVK